MLSLSLETASQNLFLLLVKVFDGRTWRWSNWHEPAPLERADHDFGHAKREHVPKRRDDFVQHDSRERRVESVAGHSFAQPIDGSFGQHVVKVVAYEEFFQVERFYLVDDRFRRFVRYDVNLFEESEKLGQLKTTLKERRID